ncbi:ATP-dependent DNA helicase RecG [Diaminobutyricimonas aerilata]|uniref:Probable DNA 3'-5' helicase RecG n=1 Tax=Diaminobutyricimonas aerilata TaxID=1162967 RepID=A0A2M9CIK4_9MICO|nr:ATP-dependent DNA helicase RecG [Diaminobutyricimonas aerilata]PJJ71692.1 ATP-dependent DNA helicase RecG [Diaminobutyricimonas aerilata]
MASPLDTKLSTALGGRTGSSFERNLGLRTVGDLLAYYPRRYAKHGELSDIETLPLDENVTIVAEVVGVQERKMRQRRGSILEVIITDGRGRLSLTFFNQAWRQNELRPGVRGIFAGKVTRYRSDLQLTHPAYELFPLDEDAAGERARKWAETPIPIYPATASVASWQIQNAVGVVLDTLPELDDPVPASIRSERRMVSYSRALELIHRPQKDADFGVARATLRFQEAFVLQAALLQQRARLRAVTATPRVPGALAAEFETALPFELTDDQRAVGEQIAADLAASAPMNRLVQGEVGSGKTLVALRAMLAVADSGGQSALLAPTEVLAAQHLRSIVRTLGPDLAARLRPTLLTGQLSTAERKKALLAAVSGSARIVVGTHALLGDNVGFYDLGLVVVDEQHRFGVDQREALRLKGATPPHVLVLTATPIPRTVAMTVFGDLDVSTITQLPAGRSPIASHVVPLAERPGWVNRIWERLAEELDQRRQGFVVCPSIGGGTPEDEQPETDGADADGGAERIASVLEMVDVVRGHPLLVGRRIEALHGRLPSDEKDRLMREFAAGRIDVLVSTTVIEVGVDVPNASTMVVLDADRFGVSQLHQLRGRVGRGSVPGLCLFVTRAEAGTLARERVEAVASTLDGFELAQKDLELRQEGDVLGSTQSGRRSSLRLLRVVKDAALISEARDLAATLIEDDPDLTRTPALAETLARRLDESERDFLAKS